MSRQRFEDAVKAFLRGIGQNGIPAIEHEDGGFRAQASGYEFVGTERCFGVKMPRDAIKGRTWVYVPVATH